MLLVCSNRCGGSLFRVLIAEVEVDSGGEYQGHRVVEPGYLCLNCGAPAFDLGEVPAELAAERTADEPVPLLDVLCPVCETRVEVGRDMECPVCGSYLEVEA
jgi:DNA-directed RNA polymerase subunit RPC12/RpoP